MLNRIFYKFSTFLFPVIATITAINMLDLPYEVRFVEQANNYFFVVILCYLLPVSSALWALTRKRTDIKIVGIVICLGLSILCFIVQLFANSSYQDIKENGIDFSFEPIHEKTIDGANYVLYRTNGGATTSYGLVLRKEVNVLFSFRIVRILHSKYKASEGELRALESGKLQLLIHPYSNGEEVDILEFEI